MAFPAGVVDRSEIGRRIVALNSTMRERLLVLDADADSADAQRAWVTTRLGLIRGTNRFLGRHMWRDAARLFILFAADLVALLVLRQILIAVRDQRMLGATAGGIAEFLLPQGAVPTVQLACAILLGLLALGTYGAGDTRRRPDLIFTGTGLGLMLLAWGELWRRPTANGLFMFALLTVLVSVSLMISRLAMDSVLRALGIPRGPRGRALVIGSGGDIARGLAHPALAGPAGVRIVGGAEITGRDGTLERHLSDLIRQIAKQHIDTLFLSGALSDRAFEGVLDVARFGGCGVFSLTRPARWRGMYPTIVWWDGVPLVQLTHPTLRGWQIAVKRVMDLVGAGLLLLLLSPVLLVVALLIRAKSPGPILFRQQRVGVGGRLFDILKFRSMSLDAPAQLSDLLAQNEYADERLFKMRDDPRITPIGRVLRRTSLDELPQLWNVLRGDMSLVGPRPPLPAEVRRYAEHHYARFDVKPGITGPWQVSGRNSITDFEDIVRLETEYIREWSVWLDLAILVRTVPAVLSKEGAY